MRYNSVFIDLDDTIWDFQANSQEAMRQTYIQSRLDKYYPDYDDFYRIYEEKNKELWELYHKGRLSKELLLIERFRYMMQRIGVVNDDLVLSLNDVYFSFTTRQKRLKPYALELLDYLRAKKYKLYILSNGFQEVQYLKMESSGILHYFDRVILSDEIGVNKPHPDIFSFALDVTSSDKEHSVMIGDNYQADILGASGSGIDQIYYNPRNLPTPELTPTYSICSLEEVLSIL